MNAKKTLSDWLADGDLDRTLRGLEVVYDHQGIKQDDDLVLQKSRYNMIKTSKLNGVISDPDYLLELGKIRHAVLELVNGLAEHWPADGLESVRPGKSHPISIPAKSFFSGKIGAFLGVSAVLAVVLIYVLRSPDSMQLTVYVQDTAGKPIPELQNIGKVIVRFDNDLRDPVIGENGRTNLGEIPNKFQDKQIEVVLVAEGYEAVSPGKKYILDGAPIYLAVQRDSSLGLIQGIVKDRSGEQFIEGALVLIDQDTTTTTDALGRFRLVLPPRKQRETYALTIKKEGFRVKNEYYKPKSGDIEIRLDK